MNGFHDLTLAGIQAFDSNHLENVLISRDFRKARIIDIDGNNRGSIQFDAESNIFITVVPSRTAPKTAAHCTSSR